MPNNQKVNPEDYKTVPKITIRNFLAGVLYRLSRTELAGTINFIHSQASNIINQYGQKNKYYCNVCNRFSPYFINNSSKFRIVWHFTCPNCHSAGRHRGLLELYRELHINMEESILHFAPETF